LGKNFHNLKLRIRGIIKILVLSINSTPPITTSRIATARIAEK
jgi:hypothetical protein